MSEFVHNHSHNLDRLIIYSTSLLNGDRGSDLYTKFQDAIKKVTPRDVITVVDELVKTNSDIGNIKRTVNKILNIFYEPLKKHGRANAENESFLYYLMAENIEMERRMKDLKEEVKGVFGQKKPLDELIRRKEQIREKLKELKEYEKHYLKKENILFPNVEKKFPDYRCVSIMWSMHDDARTSLNNLIANLGQSDPSLNEFNYELGRFYFSVLPVIFREDFILYPECLKLLSNDEWQNMLDQSFETGFAFIEAPVKISAPKKVANTAITDSLIDLETGLLEKDQITSLLNHLPVDITFVDENDEVKYFSNPKKRHFPRSKAIIGRKVQNCHPPESIETVNQILQSFKDGTKDSESFWINIKGKFIFIQYFAVRDGNGIYKGTVEVSQDVTEIRELRGEKRIMDV